MTTATFTSLRKKCASLSLIFFAILIVISATAHSMDGYKLTIEATPSDARIRILNIRPKYQPGMTLPVGRYHIDVSKTGYETERRWVELSGERQVFSFTLKERDKASKPLPVVKSKKPAPGDEWRDSVTGMEFSWVPGGCFLMGSTQGSFRRERPVHKVCVDGFWMGIYEVTQGQWKKIMGTNPSYFKRGDDYPVELVSWNDAQNLIKKLNSKGLGHFRLPTEAEWEYACRGGGGGPQETACGVSTEGKIIALNEVQRQVAWYDVLNKPDETHPVGWKKANKFGLYDMSGNVKEWASDWLDEEYYSKSPKKNPKGPSSGRYRVNRGGSYGTMAPFDVGAARRGGASPDSRNPHLGFRLLRTYP